MFKRHQWILFGDFNRNNFFCLFHQHFLIRIYTAHFFFLFYRNIDFECGCLLSFQFKSIKCCIFCVFNLFDLHSPCFSCWVSTTNQLETKAQLFFYILYNFRNSCVQFIGSTQNKKCLSVNWNWMCEEKKTESKINDLKKICVMQPRERIRFLLWCRTEYSL